MNTGSINIYFSSVGASPVNQYDVSPSISSAGTVVLPSAASAFNIPNLVPGFNFKTAQIVCYSRYLWTSNTTIINYQFGSNVKIVYNADFNRLELSGLTPGNLSVSQSNYPGGTNLAAVLYLTWT